ncbi:hypothetical protein HA402_009493 [Bradysia odoriphaga]|nr:hypothetical protein HA402_009493 [Bradysia odoriphaga]
MDLWDYEASLSSSDGLSAEGKVVNSMRPAPNSISTILGAVQEKHNKELTILMVGETGVGKSTFINAIVNYLMFENMADAAKNLKCVIPTSFEVYDEFTMSMKECSFGGTDDNECDDKTQSSTQNCKCYNIDVGDLRLKIIDTPGIADCRGVERDRLNIKNILHFLSNFKELNAICVLLKPNNAKVSILFKYCILELLTHLNKSASENILFLFTNSRGTFYKPGDTAKPLRKVLEEIRLRPPNVEIKFDRESCFCFDSEAFRYLVAMSEPNDIVFDHDAHDDYATSWQRSVRECERLFKRIADIKPHSVQDTISINNIKSKIINLRKPIALIIENISKEIVLCQDHEKKINEFSGDIQELEKELYTPSLDIITEPLDGPITVCSDPECCEKRSFGNVSKVHYKSICHKPCYLKNSDGNIVGDVALLDCQAFNKYKRYGKGRMFDAKEFWPDNKLKCNKNGRMFGWDCVRTRSETCFECSHSYLVHLTINYETKVETKQIRDNNKQKRIEMNKQNIDAKQLQINKINEKVAQIKEELRFIMECSAYFAKFLMANAITPFNDALEEYIKCCIANERNRNGDAAVIDGLKAMLQSYAREKEEIEKLAEESSDVAELTSDEINAKIEQLVRLKHYGPIIKLHMDIEAQAQVKAATGFEKDISVGPEKMSGLAAFLSQFPSQLKFW